MVDATWAIYLIIYNCANLAVSDDAVNCLISKGKADSIGKGKP